MPLQNRSTLYNFFKKGQMPAESHFKDLIDSMLNKVDDGLTKTTDEGLTLSPIGSKKLMSFFKSIEEKNPAWSIEIDSGNALLNFKNSLGASALSLQHDGKVGILNEIPQHELDVNGFVGMKGRTGTFKTGQILANGQWQPILQNLNGCVMFEVTGGVGKKRTGKYALVHAFCMSTFGGSNNKIQIHQAYYGTRCNKIELRWTGTTYDFNLEMRTRCSYDGEYFVNYQIASLWEDTFMNESTKGSE